jgi:hypothetical protein
MANIVIFKIVLKALEHQMESIWGLASATEAGVAPFTHVASCSNQRHCDLSVDLDEVEVLLAIHLEHED